MKLKELIEKKEEEEDLKNDTPFCFLIVFYLNGKVKENKILFTMMKSKHMI